MKSFRYHPGARIQEFEYAVGDHPIQARDLDPGDETGVGTAWAEVSKLPATLLTSNYFACRIGEEGFQADRL
jgi:hypothetical protein